MIIETTVNGRPARVAYLNDKFEPVDEKDATRVKVLFMDDEGGAVFLVPGQGNGPPPKR